MSNIVLLGSTGSIGTQTLDVCRMNNISVKALSANTNEDLLEKQAREFNAEYVCIYDNKHYKSMQTRLADTNTKVLTGMDGLCELASLKCDKVVNSVVGMIGLRPTLAAAESGNNIALANKETLVAGGNLVLEAVKKNNIQLLPIDSEHSAIFQCLMGAMGNPISKILLTASGGPFFGKSKEELADVTREQALRHPNWSMGSKITIDSSTLMNKGLELIEAVRLFDVKSEQIEIVVHRQSIIHSAVEFEDGAVIAQLGTPDMRIPIQLALTYPERIKSPAKRLSLFDVKTMTFDKPDEETFICLSAARKAISMDGNAPCIINSANEAAVSLFLNNKIRFLQIGEIVCSALEKMPFIQQPCLDDIFNTQQNTEQYVYDNFG